MHFQIGLRSIVPTLAVFALYLVQARPAAAAAPSSCEITLPPSSQYPALFQKEIDATHSFVLQVRRLDPPDGWYAQIGYVALDASGHVQAINPTLLAVPGTRMHFTFVNCLGEDEIAWITGYNALDPALPFSPVAGSFNAFPAEEMVPTGYSNVHTHGMHGPPIAGTPTTDAGDEVLTTFASPVSRPSSDATVSNQQTYSIKIPAKQDPGLYWYHPHLHGEAQPEVFLGLTGSIRILRKRAGDTSGAATLASEIAEHSDPSEHPAVFVIRDYPVNPPPDPGAQASTTASPSIASPASAARLRAPAGTGAQQHYQARRHRSQYLQSTVGGRAPTATPAVSPSALLGPRPVRTASASNPRCALVVAVDASPLCLPDAVSPDPSATSVTPPSLGTLITVNGRQTDLPSGGTVDAPTRLDFKAIAPSTTDRVLRVLNASANTYVKLSLSPAPLAGIDLSDATTTSVPTVKLTQFRRDGAPVRTQNRAVDFILLPPGGRAEFTAAPGVSQPLSLVSQYYNTGPAGDLVPPRTLASLSSAVAPAQAAVTAHAAVTAESIESTPERSERFPQVYVAHPHATRRALAFFEQDRPCDQTDPKRDCGTTFYLLDITSSAVGIGGTKTPLTEAHAFSLPMGMVDGNPVPVRDLFETPGGRFKAPTPSIQVSLHGQPEVDEEWTIYNFTGESHAFHIHQLGFFVDVACSPAYLQLQHHSPNCVGVSNRSGDENHETGLVLDVINLPPAISIPNADPLKNVVFPAKVHLRVPFTQDIKGNFVMHCHLLEHEDNGMMMGVQVWSNSPPPGKDTRFVSTIMP